MKATGIIRRIDDLGRVVIPREIRRLTGITCDEPVEFFIDTETNSVCLKKYSPLGEFGNYLDILKENLDFIENYRPRNEAEAMIEKLRKIFEENT